MLMRMYEKRLKGYKAIGYSVQAVEDVSERGLIGDGNNKMRN
jgi:hypothetical protein